MKTYSQMVPTSKEREVALTARVKSLCQAAVAVTVTEVKSTKELPKTELYGPVTAGSLEAAQKSADYYGLDGYWYAGNKTLYLIPAPPPPTVDGEKP